MGIFFGKHKKQPSRVTQQDLAILQLKQQRDKLKQYQKRIEQSLESDREMARKCLQNGRKERAKLLLRKKKYQEQLLKNTDNQLENLERLASDIEFAQVEIKVMDGLKFGNEALKKVHEVLNIDEIEQILDETREAVSKQNELDELLSGALSNEEEEDVELELEELLEQEENKEANVEDMLPEVPDTELPKRSAEKDKSKKSARETVALEA